MNQLYTITYDGRVFTANASSSSFEQLNPDEDDEQLKIKRLSSSDYCIWAISSKFQVLLYVFKNDVPIEHQEVTYENQRRFNLFSSESFGKKLLKTDRPYYSSKDGEVRLDKESFKLPSNNWTWSTEWDYEHNLSDGWEYAVDFPATYYPKFFATSCVRRRMWTRTRRFTNTNSFIKIEDPNHDECIIDVQVGGWTLPYCAKNYLSVWSVSNSGRLYFKKGISNENLEGTKWVLVDTINRDIASCTCSKTGGLLVLTFDGELILRTNITRENPIGIGWVTINPPSLESNVRQVALGSCSIWAIDNQGDLYFRAGVRDENPRGTKWVSIPGSMSSISLSSSNQLWAIDLRDRALYLRTGIDEREDLSGTGWKLISLKSKQTIRKLYDGDSISLIHKQNSKSSETSSEVQSLNQTVIKIDEKEQQQNIELNQEEQPKQEEVTEENEDNFESIYDSIYDSESQNQHEESPKTPTNIKNSTVNEVKEINNLDKFLNTKSPTVWSTKLDEYDEKSVDNFINRFKSSETPAHHSSLPDLETKERSLSRSSHASSVTVESANSSNFYEQEETRSISTQSFTSEILIDIDFRECVANSFTTEAAKLPNCWFGTNCESVFSNFDSEEWKIEILNDLKNRNIREHLNIDKITFSYENEKDAWSRSESFYYVHKAQKVPCLLEIITDSSSKTSSQHFEAVLCIKLKKKNEKYETVKTIHFDQISLVTRWATSLGSNPCFALFIAPNDQPMVFVSESEGKLNDWTNQISIYCSKISIIYSGVSSLVSAITLVNTDGNAYFAYIINNHAELIKQIDGHMKLVEKHLCGVTYGIGENGKLWYLAVKNNLALDNYQGSYTQTDELEITTYENQRWNVISGLIDIKNGFTDIGFPTDRYNWSDETGKFRRRKQDCVLPSSQFTWTSGWKIDFSTPGGVDSEGWQYAFDFPSEYHGVKTPKDFVRRRRWARKCKFRASTFWKEINQTHKLISIALDQERNNKNLTLPDKTILMWAIDHDGFVLSALIDQNNPCSIRWQHVAGTQSFQYIAIGFNLKIWGLDTNGNAWFRLSVSKENNFRGTSWSLVSDEKDDLKFKSISVGHNSVWAISNENDLYFRENVTKTFPEGTSWIKVDSNVLSVSVNYKNQVYAVKSVGFKSNETCLFYRNGVTNDNLKGMGWNSLTLLKMKLKSVSNKGKST